MVRICHFSDWHAQFNNLPEADVYVCTGDMLDNYPILKRNAGAVAVFGSFGLQYSRTIDHEKEKNCQEQWFKKRFTDRGRPLGLRHFFPKNCKHNPVVVVRGNHEFTDLGPMFGGEVFEIGFDSSAAVEYCGLKFGGFRGVPTLIREWCDEFEDPYFDDQVDRLPNDLDVVVTHAPPWGFLDGYNNEHLGIKALGSWINSKQYDGTIMPRLFCFGHIHGRYGKLELDDGTIFSNAATGKRIINLEVNR